MKCQVMFYGIICYDLLQGYSFYKFLAFMNFSDGICYGN